MRWNGLFAAKARVRGSLQLSSAGAGDDYQRCLWYAFAGRDPLVVATVLRRAPRS